MHAIGDGTRQRTRAHRGRRLALVAMLVLQGCATPRPPAAPDAPAAPTAPPALVVRTVEHTMAGTALPMDVYLPQGPARGAVVLVHGFSRGRGTMAGHALALAGQGVMALAPDMPGGVDVTRSAQALAELVRVVRSGEGPVPATSAVVLVGFSAGALSTLLAADVPGVVGWVGLDPVDRRDGGDLGGVGRRAAAALATEGWIVRAPPSRCNAQGSAEGWGALLRHRVADDRIEGASHCDFEAPSGPLCVWACGPTDAQRQARVRDALLQAVDRWLPRPASTR